MINVSSLRFIFYNANKYQYNDYNFHFFYYRRRLFHYYNIFFAIYCFMCILMYYVSCFHNRCARAHAHGLQATLLRQSKVGAAFDTQQSLRMAQS